MLLAAVLPVAVAFLVPTMAMGGRETKSGIFPLTNSAHGKAEICFSNSGYSTSSGVKTRCPIFKANSNSASALEIDQVLIRYISFWVKYPSKSHA